MILWLRVLVLVLVVPCVSATLLVLSFYTPDGAAAIDRDGTVLFVFIFGVLAIVFFLLMLYSTVRIAIADDRRRQLLDDVDEMKREQQKRSLQR